MTKTRVSTMVKSQCSSFAAMVTMNSSLGFVLAAYNIPRSSTATASAPIVSQMKKVCSNLLYSSSTACLTTPRLVDQRTGSRQCRFSYPEVSLWFRQEARRTPRWNEEEPLFRQRTFTLSIPAVREDAQHVSPAKPAASSRVSGAWKKVRAKRKRTFAFDRLLNRMATIWRMNETDAS